MNLLIGEKLKQLRRSKNYSAERVADELKTALSTYMRMENGKTATWTRMVDKICTLYEIEPEELFLSKEKYVQINNNQNGGSESKIANHYHDEKLIELYEKLIAEKDKRIADLERSE